MKQLIFSAVSLLLTVCLSAEPEVKIDKSTSPAKAFRITLTEAAEITVGGARLSKEQLAGVLSAIAEGVEEPSVLLEAPPEAVHAEVMKLHQLLLESGIDPERIRIGLTNQAPNSKKVDEGGTGQPGTQSESKSKGGDKPQPEADGRSR